METAAPAPAGVLIHYRAGSAAGQVAARRIAEEVRRAGLGVIGLRAETAVPSMREVLYPACGAATEAERLAARLRSRWGNAWRVQTKEESGPDRAAPGSAPNVLEVWLPHR